MHIAFALKTPTVSIFGQIKPSLRVPREDYLRHSIIYIPTLQSENEVHATQRKQLNNDNLFKVSVEQIFDAVMERLERTAFAIH